MHYLSLHEPFHSSSLPQGFLTLIKFNSFPLTLHCFQRIKKHEIKNKEIGQLRTKLNLRKNFQNKKLLRCTFNDDVKLLKEITTAKTKTAVYKPNDLN